ncbi:hypothetical protein Pan258_18730 [Symmachiella dynata]|nr:hypothetical protein Pan258_18730 [Symmachiella dynata]
MRTLFLCLFILPQAAWAQPATVGPQLPTSEVSFSVPTSQPSELSYGIPAGCGPAVCAAPDDDGMITFSSAVLFWKVTEGSAENWAQEITPLGIGTTFGTATLVDAPFEWKAGIRIGAAYQPPDSDFDLSVSYTHFGTNATNQATGEVYSAFLGNFYVGNPDGTSFGPHYSNASIDWDFQFDSIDLELGREFAISDSLSLRPFVGLKSAMIDQSIHSNWSSPINTSSQTYLFTAAEEELNQDFWGIGPSLGVNAVIPIVSETDYSLRIFASPSAAIMYGRWTFKDQYRNNGPTSTTHPTPAVVDINSDPITGAATMARGVLGLEWVQYGSEITTSLRLGYEAQIWLNQMQFYSYNMGRLNNLMSLHGGVFELSLNF